MAKKKKEKIIYYDDNSTIADMSSVNRTGKKQERPQKPRSTAKEKWNTYWAAVSKMWVPMFIVLGVLGILYLLLMWIGGNLG